MLLHRVITAIVLLAILLPAMFAGSPLAFQVCAWALLTAAAWEWARLSVPEDERSEMGSISFAAVFGVLALGAYAMNYTTGGGAIWAAIWVIVASLWVMGGVWILARGVAGWQRVSVAVKLVGGLLVLVAAWLAVAQARGVGVNFLLSALVLVWAADIGAYAGGKTLSRRFPAKLAPAISPGKTWVGAISGAVCSFGVALAWIAVEDRLGAQTLGAPSLPLRLWHLGAIFLLIGAMAVVAMSIVGDLFESLLKRAVGAKDSSGLLPGHGGVLDRIDALLPTLPLAMMLALLAERMA